MGDTDSGALRMLTAADLERAMRARDPRTRLVAPRVLRRIARSERLARTFSLSLAHRRSLTVGTDAALRAASPEELGLGADQERPELLLLIEQPDGPMPEATGLLWAWRRLFHARAHAELMGRIAAGGLRCEDLAHRVEALGPGVFDEARSVLERDGWLALVQDECAAYVEFVVVFFELKHFAERLLPAYFPRIEEFDRVASVLGRDLDGAALFAATRPDGAPGPTPHPTVEDIPPPDPAPETEETPARSEARFRWLMARADAARKLGNVVRSAILRNRAARLVGPSRAGQARSGASDDLDALARRLGSALGEDVCPPSRIRQPLKELLRYTARSAWTVEGRLLFDLQTICVDSERAIYELDLAGWIVSFGKRPLRRPLPNQKVVRVAKGLTRASGRLPRARLDETSRAILAESLREAHETTENTARERFRPLLAKALDRAGLKPTNLPERVSFDRMVEELLDHVVGQNHVTMGDVRDAIARSDLRQPDLESPKELWKGDRVLRADRKMRVSLDGVYHPGEIYLRFLQTLSFLVFGTAIGRFLTRYVFLPYGIAFGALVTIQELLGFARIHVHMVHLPEVAIVGTWVLLILHVRRVRDWSIRAGGIAWGGVRFAFVGAPSWLLQTHAIRAMLASTWFDRVRRLLLEPSVVGVATYLLVWWLDRDRSVATGFALGAFAATSFFLGTSFGRAAEEVASDAAARGWRRVRSDLLPGMIRLVLEVFDTFLEWVERLIYAVDEALRYRSGEGRASLWIKAALGMIWGAVTYLLRIFLNLMVEPTVNPVKHFPTVTVAAKMILPKVEPWTAALAARFAFLGSFLAWSIAGTLFVFLPGLAGFFVWELKENWRLFAANRPKTLRPVMVGHHGETIRRLLLPGFHSGTIPKLFARLRHAAKIAYATGDARKARKAHSALHHVEEPIRHHVERGFAAILIGSGRFEPSELRISDVELATNRIAVRFAPPEGAERGLEIAFDAEDGHVAMRVDDEDWRSRLTGDRRAAYDGAIVEMAARSGSDMLEGAGLRELPAPFAEPAEGERVGLPPVAWEQWITFWGEPERQEVGAQKSD